MRRLGVIFLVLLSLTGCGRNSELNEVIQWRERILKSNGYTFCAQITADYGNEVYTFSVNCIFDQAGAMKFTVNAPQTLNGITGIISNDQGKLTFDEQVLLFPLLADDQISPISAPWLVNKALRSGYIQACGRESDNLKIILDDSFGTDALQVELWITDDWIPAAADILWQNRRILAIEIDSFAYL